jgi:hypothetical protein
VSFPCSTDLTNGIGAGEQLQVLNGALLLDLYSATRENSGLKMTVNCSLEPGICPSCIHSVKKAQEDMKEVK